jgi:hypothetical protein
MVGVRNTSEGEFGDLVGGRHGRELEFKAWLQCRGVGHLGVDVDDQIVASRTAGGRE